ncbi:MAG: acyltransferase family protein [Terriglobia bacterium]
MPHSSEATILDVNPSFTNSSPRNLQPITRPQERILSLDVLRGFDMFWITGGEGIIHTLAAATGWQFFRVFSMELEHVKWEGFHFYDLIFPLFLFLMGASIPYALIGKLERGVPRKAIYKKIFTRFFILFILGLVYNQKWITDWLHPRVGSVLGQIAFGYLFASLIALHSAKLRSILLWLGGVLGVNALIQFLIPVPGYGAGVFTPQGSINYYVDRMFMPGSFLYYITPDGTSYSLAQIRPPNAFPMYGVEGFVDWFSVIIIALMGVTAGLILRNQKVSPHRKLGIYVATGLGCLLAALILKRWYPIIKLLQTDTFYLFAGGFCFLLLALFYFLIDVKKFQKWGFFFKVIGMNAITVYLGFQLIDVDHTSTVLVGGWAKYLGAYGPVLISIVTVALVWMSLYGLYRKKIFLRV